MLRSALALNRLITVCSICDSLQIYSITNQIFKNLGMYHSRQFHVGVHDVESSLQTLCNLNLWNNNILGTSYMIT